MKVPSPCHGPAYSSGQGAPTTPGSRPASYAFLKSSRGTAFFSSHSEQKGVTCCTGAQRQLPPQRVRDDRAQPEPHPAATRRRGGNSPLLQRERRGGKRSPMTHSNCEPSGSVSMSFSRPA